MTLPRKLAEDGAGSRLVDSLAQRAPTTCTISFRHYKVGDKRCELHKMDKMQSKAVVSTLKKIEDGQPPRDEVKGNSSYAFLYEGFFGESQGLPIREYTLDRGGRVFGALSGSVFFVLLIKLKHI